jgi:hypothetical protein
MTSRLDNAWFRWDKEPSRFNLKNLARELKSLQEEESTLNKLKKLMKKIKDGPEGHT